MNKQISFIIPSRNNLKYLKWSYNSIRKNCGYEHELCFADDFSNDGTLEWLNELKKIDHNIKILRNDGPIRLGHTILYDKLIKISSNEIFIIWHADMYATTNIIDEIYKYINEKTIVSITRVEPSLHPAGPEKLQFDCGLEPEEFDEIKFLDFVEIQRNDNKITNGIFAPWACYKKTFQEIGGHDWLFYPQSREDSDIFNRLKLHGCKFIQTWNAFVYHLTCRGSRFNPQLTTPGKASEEWLEHNKKSERNFTRKWKQFINHDKNLSPVIKHIYDMAFVLDYSHPYYIELFEPWCNKLFIDWSNYGEFKKDYIDKEQKNTLFDLNKKIQSNDQVDTLHDIYVYVNCENLNSQNINNLLVNLPDVLTQNKQNINVNETFEYDVFKIYIQNEIQTYENKLIKVDNSKYNIDISNVVEIK